MDIGSVATAVELAKRAYEVAKKANLVELQETMLDLRQAVADSRDEVLQLRARVRELEDALAQKSALDWDGVVYWMRDGERRNGPYCPKCHDGDGAKLARLSAVDRQYFGKQWHCAVCQTDFAGTQGWEKPPLI